MKKRIFLLVAIVILITSITSIVIAGEMCPQCFENSMYPYCDGFYENEVEYHVVEDALENQYDCVGNVVRDYTLDRCITYGCYYDETTRSHIEYQGEHLYYMHGYCTIGYQSLCSYPAS